jgi:hypothetical protein
MVEELSWESFIKYAASGDATMISPKLAMLTAFMAAASVGAFAVPAMAQDIDQDVSRDNTNNQFIAQSNEACTNTVLASEDDWGDQYVKADQSNKCYVVQSNTATQDANIDDYSFNKIVNFAFQDFDPEDPKDPHNGY